MDSNQYLIHCDTWNYLDDIEQALEQQSEIIIRKHKMYGIIIRRKQYCRKTELIAYLSEPIQLVKTKNRTYYRLIDKFMETMMK